MDFVVRLFECFWLLFLFSFLSLPDVQGQPSFRPAGVYTSGSGFTSGSGSSYGSRNGRLPGYGMVSNGAGPVYRTAGVSVSTSQRTQVSKEFTIQYNAIQYNTI